MTIDTFLGLLGAATGLVGLFFAYHFYKKSVRTKVLAIAYTEPIPLMMTLGNLEVVYEGVSVAALSSVYILLWNRGTAPIEASDFLTPIRIGASAPILNLRIHDKDAAAAANLDERARSLAINLLRPGEAITLVAEVTSAAYRPDIQVEMKSADMSTLISGLHSLYPAIVAVSTFFLVLGAELVILSLFKDAFPSGEPDSPYGPLFKEDPGFFIFMGSMLGITFAAVFSLSIIPLIVTAVAQRLTRSFLARVVTPVAWKFSEFKVSAAMMQVRLKQFRKVIDAEYKKIAPT